MCKELFKSLCLSPAVALLILSSCGGKTEQTVAAENLLQQAQLALDSGDTETAIVLLDSIQHQYQKEIEVGREALALRPKVIEKQTIREITKTDSLLAVYSALHENSVALMKKIADKDLVEPYYVAKSGFNPNFLSAPAAIQPRVSEIGEFYILSSVNGKNLKHTSFSLKTGSDEVSVTPVAYDGERNYRLNGSELITYPSQDCDTIGRFANDNSGKSISVVFHGEKGKPISVKLSAAEVKGIADAWNYSRSITESRELTVQREKLDRRLQIARDQIARTIKE